VVIVPAMNHPAFCAGTRASPIDRGNLNRSFPGRPDGTVTEKIADYFTRYLLPLADIVLDFHSGGRTLEFLPLAAAHRLPDVQQEQRCFAAVTAFAAPYSLAMREIDAVGMYDSTAEALGKVFVTTELGGGGTARAAIVAIAKRGVRNLLRHTGILTGEPESAPTTWLDMGSSNCFVFAEEGGLIEPCKDLGASVRTDEVVARIHRTARTGLRPVECRASAAGILAGRHYPGLVKIGDCVAVFAAIGPAAPESTR
jgi:N-alpha-acetyl-L-2,4-diaminobutyrate deacetylase